jgi:TonB family protein
MPLSVAAVILSGILLATLWKNRATQHEAAFPAVIAASAPLSSLTPIHLNVRREGPEGNLTWNHTAELIEQADRGALQIHDGASSWELPLDRNELRTGSIRYLPKSGRVKFQLEVFSPNRSVTESVIALDSGYQPEKAEPAKGAADRGPLTPQRPRKAKQDVEPRQAPTLLATASSARASEHDVASLPDPPHLPPAPLVPTPRASIGRGNSPEMHLAVTTLFEPVGPSRIRKALKFVSPTRLMRHHEAPEAPPSPIREITPEAPSRATLGSRDSVEVDVRIAIDTHGTVSSAWLESKENGLLSEAALAAARNWKFKPASKNNSLIESEAILHFRFQNPELAAVKP